MGSERRRHARCLILAMSWLAAWASTAAAAEADTVELHFGWPDEVRLRVDRSFDRSEMRPTEKGPAPVSSATRFMWRGARSGDRYEISFGDFEVVEGEPRPGSRDAIVQIEYTSRKLEPLLPTIVVDAEGQPIDLGGLAKLREKLRAEYLTVPGLGDDPQALQAVEILTSEEVVTHRSLEDWNRMVQIWHGVDEKVGHTEELTGETGVAPGTAIQNRFRYSIDSRIPCSPSDESNRCVRLIVEQIPDFDDARAAAHALLGFDFVAALGAPRDASLEFVSTFTTDTHPESLLPIRYLKEKHWAVRWNDPTAGPQAVGRTDRWTYRFECQKGCERQK